MTTSSEQTDNEIKRLQSGSTDGEQTEKTNIKVNDLNQSNKTDSSSNEEKKSDQTSDSNSKQKNADQTVETTTTHQTEETIVASSSSSSNVNNNEDSQKDQLSATSNETQKDESRTNANEKSSSNQENDFSIDKDDGEHLTDFQRQKARFFFHVNLDIENKEYISWEDVEFYLLFHVTAAGKEGAEGGDLEARLSRAARAFWEHVHDQMPLADGKRDMLTINQFLDTWASLIDYVVRTNKLPAVVQDLVKLGFELYATDNGDDKSATIQPQAFDQLFQKMNLGRPYAIMAYKYLTDNGTKPLDADKIDSIVKAVITSSDDDHESHFLLPGFFKTIADNKNKSSSPTQDKDQSSSSSSVPKSPSSPPTSQPQPSNDSSASQSEPSKTPTSPQDKQKPSESSQSQQQNIPSSPTAQEKKQDSSTLSPKQPSTPSQNNTIQSPPSTNQPQILSPPSPPVPQKVKIQQEDESIRRLLHYYHIDDGDIVEVAGGSVQRLVLIHPERPLPTYLQQNKQLLQQLQSGPTNLSSAQQNGFNNFNANPQTPATSSETKPKVTLEERVSRGEAQKGPTVPSRPDQKQDNASSTGVRQVYPQLNEAQQAEQQRQAKLQASHSTKDEKPSKEDTSITHDISSTSKQDESKQSKDFSRDDEEKIIAAVLKQLTPIVEKRVAAELRRIQSGDTDDDEDDDAIPFPFMLAGGFPFFAAPRGGPPQPPPQGFPGQQQQQTFQQNAFAQGEQQSPNAPREAAFGGIPGGAGMFPPQLLMAMMNDLARGGMQGDAHGFPTNMPPPHHGPAGVEGFMMFVDDDQFMGSPPRYPPRPGPFS